MLAGKSGRE